MGLVNRNYGKNNLFLLVPLRNISVDGLDFTRILCFKIILKLALYNIDIWWGAHNALAL